MHTSQLIICIVYSTQLDIAGWSDALCEGVREQHLHFKRLRPSVLAHVLPGYQVIHEDSCTTVSAALDKCSSPAKRLYKHKHIWTIYLPAGKFIRI